MKISRFGSWVRHSVSFASQRALCIGAAAALLACAARPAAATPYDTLESIAGSYNMFLLGDLGTAGSPYTADMQGAVAIGGNAYMNGVSVDANQTGPAGLVVGGNLSQNGGSDYGNVFVGGNASISSGGGVNNLTVGGSLSATGGTYGGNVFVGGAGATLAGGTTINGSLSMTAAGSTLTSGDASSPKAIYVTASTLVKDPAYWAKPATTGGPATPTNPVDFYGSATDLKNASTALSAAGATTVTASGGNITITLNQSGLNVINLNVPDGATINGINIVNASGVIPTGLVINVNGNKLNFNGWTYNLGTLGTNQVLFNFPTATAITLGNLAFQGALLAPLATVNFTSGQFNGTLIANNYLGAGQINNGNGLTTSLPSYVSPGGLSSVAPIPEPASLTLFGAGLVVTALTRRRMIRRAGLV